ncbi:MAG: hypothetical protein ACE5HE_14525 [Phycisphaerae bacterium]
MHQGSGNGGMMAAGARVKGGDHLDEAATTPAPTPCASRAIRRRAAVDKVLPPELIEELQAVIATAPLVNVELTREIDKRFGIGKRFSVPTQQLRRYLQRLHDRRVAEQVCANKHSDEAEGNGRAGMGDSDGEQAPGLRERLRAHRTRQMSIASILDATFGPLAQSNPELWDRRAYLMLVGLVYDRLASAEEELPSAEIIALAKVLSEARRAEARARDHQRAGESKDAATTPLGPLPQSFADVVRQVYGTNFHDPEECRAPDTNAAHQPSPTSPSSA